MSAIPTSFRKLFCITLFFLFIHGLKAQNIEVLECRYDQYIIRSNDTNHLIRTVWFRQNKIFEFSNNDTAGINSLTDFNLNTSVLSNNGFSNITSINEGRKPVSIISTKAFINEFETQELLVVKDTFTSTNYATSTNITEDSVYIDTATRIPYYSKGGFFDWLDNGSGFLPVKFIRMITKSDGSEIKAVCVLTQKRKTFVNKKYFKE